MEIDAPLTHLSNQIWITSRCRFIAARRSRKKHTAYVFSISFLSLFQVFISLSSFIELQSIYFLTGKQIAFVTLVISVIILVIANQDSLSTLLKQADSYHRCGNQLKKLHNELEYILKTNEDYSKYNHHLYTDKYYGTLEAYDLNHTHADYLKMRTEGKHDWNPTKKWDKYIFTARYYINIYLTPSVYCVIPFSIYIFFLTQSCTP